MQFTEVVNKRGGQEFVQILFIVKAVFIRSRLRVCGHRWRLF
jgi:hypothetical protein